MSATADLLDKAREACKLPSDNALAERVGVTRAMIWKARHGEKPLSDERIAQLCALAKLDGPEWMAKIHAERAQTPAERALWSKMLTRLAAAAILAAPFAAFGNEKAPEIKGFSGESAASVYYVNALMCLHRRPTSNPALTVTGACCFRQISCSAQLGPALLRGSNRYSNGAASMPRRHRSGEPLPQ